MLPCEPWDTPRYDKLYVVGRGDLTPGQQAAQAVHAAFQFALEFPETAADWHPGTLIVLSVPDEDSLLDLLDQLHLAELQYTYFVEPDYTPELQHTAVAIAPSEEAANLLAHLPLALREIHPRRRLNTVAGGHALGGLRKTSRLLIRLMRVRLPSRAPK